MVFIFLWQGFNLHNLSCFCVNGAIGIWCGTAFSLLFCFIYELSYLRMYLVSHSVLHVCMYVTI